ncbi:MAG: methyltransferase domain-containing protein [Candidatus Dormiibacterota bacterium]
MAENPSDEVHHPIFARLFSVVGKGLDGFEREHRQELNSDLSGRVIEVGCGAGVNLEYYPKAVTYVLAVEPEPSLRKQAVRAGDRAPVPVRVVAGVGERLPAEAEEFDAAVTSLVLCTIPDPVAALREIHRVLRPGGQLRFYEHVAAEGSLARHFQHALDATVWPKLAGGCHCGRDSQDAIVAAGFEVVRSRRFMVKPLGIPSHLAPFIMGTAVRD